MDLTAIISENVRRVRRNLSLTQKEFATRAGVSHHTITSIEHGNATSFDVLEKLANAFELDPAELVSITPTESEPSHGIENDGVVVDDNLESLPPPMQSLYKLLVEQYEKLHGGLVTSSNNDFIGKIANDIEKGIDLIDVKHMTVVEVKRAAIDVVRNITAAHQHDIKYSQAIDYGSPVLAAFKRSITQEPILHLMNVKAIAEKGA